MPENPLASFSAIRRDWQFIYRPNSMSSYQFSTYTQKHDFNKHFLRVILKISFTCSFKKLIIC